MTLSHRERILKAAARFREGFDQTCALFERAAIEVQSPETPYGIVPLCVIVWMPPELRPEEETMTCAASG